MKDDKIVEMVSVFFYMKENKFIYVFYGIF